MQGVNYLISRFYSGSVIIALVSLFPDIGLEPKKFAKLPRTVTLTLKTLKVTLLQRIIGTMRATGEIFLLISQIRVISIHLHLTRMLG